MSASLSSMTRRALMPSLAKHWQRIAVTLILLVFALLHATGIMPLGILQRLDDIIYDVRLRARPCRAQWMIGSSSSISTRKAWLKSAFSLGRKMLAVAGHPVSAAKPACWDLF